MLMRRFALALLLGGAVASACALGPAAPFMPPDAAASAPAAEAIAALPSADVIGLAGVRFGSTPQALIDGRWHRTGDAVRGALLMSVTRKGVTLQHPDGRVDQLFLLPSAAAPERARP